MSESESDTSVQAQELQRLWKSYEERPPDFEIFDIIEQPEIETLFDKAIDKKKYMDRPQGLSQRHKYRPKSYKVENLDTSDEAKLLEWKSSDNEKAEEISKFLRKINKALDWVSFLMNIEASYDQIQISESGHNCLQKFEEIFLPVAII